MEAGKEKGRTAIQRTRGLDGRGGRGDAELQSLLGREILLSRHRQVRALSRGREPWEDGYALGEAARRALGPADGPIAEVEATFIRSFGIHVVSVRFADPAIEAASIWEPGAAPVVLLNQEAGRVEYRMSRRAILAHELCHLLHDAGDGEIVTRVTCRDGQGNYGEALEQRARGFAPAYLAPRAWVREWSRLLRSPLEPADLVVELASRWGLSLEGAVWHAKNSGLIAPEVADALLRRTLKAALPAEAFEQEDLSFPPVMVNPELPERASPLMEGWGASVVIDALEAGVISVGRANELLTY